MEDLSRKLATKEEASSTSTDNVEALVSEVYKLIDKLSLTEELCSENMVPELESKLYSTHDDLKNKSTEL